MVYYCPGESCGSPAGLSVFEAEKELVKDNEYLALLERIGVKVRYWQHIGGRCDRCRPVRPKEGR